MSKQKVKRILLTGGGSGGSVAPLLAVAEELRNPPNHLYQGGRFEFLWLGTKFGPERIMVEGAGIKFRAIAGGKWRRYFSFKNLADILKIKLGFWQAFFIMLKWRPDIVISAGSFISVPVVWAAWLLRVPILIHQQDIQAGLANKLMAPLARVATVTFEKSLDDYGKKAMWTGNPTRKLQITTRLPDGQDYKLQIKRQNYLPVALILGGGTGAEAINRLIKRSANELIKFCNIILITGKNKNQNFQFPTRPNGHPPGRMSVRTGSSGRISNFQYYEFLDAEQMAEAMRLADLVITRAGMATLSELSSLSKPSIIIPMPESHQEANAEFFKSREAAVVIEQKSLTKENFSLTIKKLLADGKMLEKLSVNMGQAMKRGAREELVKVILKIIEK